MEAQQLYIKITLLALKSTSHLSKRRIHELSSGIIELRQLLSCAVCSQLLIDPFKPKGRRCDHHVCRLCLRGRKRLTPGCAQCYDCSDFKTYEENKSMATQLLCYRTLCVHLLQSSLFSQLAQYRPNNECYYRLPRPPRIEMPDQTTQWFIQEGANYEDMWEPFSTLPELPKMLRAPSSLPAETPPTTAATTPEPYEQQMPDELSITDSELEAAATGEQSHFDQPLPLMTAGARTFSHQHMETQPQMLSAAYLEPSWSDQVDLSGALTLPAYADSPTYTTYVMPSSELHMPTIGQVVQLPQQLPTTTTRTTAYEPVAACTSIEPSYKRRHSELLRDELPVEEADLMTCTQPAVVRQRTHSSLMNLRNHKATIISSVQVKPPTASRASFVTAAPVLTEAPVIVSVPAPVYATAEAPVYATAETPAYATTETPVYATAEVPVYATEEAPMYASAEVPVYATEEASVYATAEVPVYATEEAPVYATAEIPMYATVEAPVYATAEAPVVAVTAAHVVASAPPDPVVAVAPTPVVIIAAAPVVAKAAPPVVENAAAPVVENVAAPAVAIAEPPAVAKAVAPAVGKAAAPAAEEAVAPAAEEAVAPAVEKSVAPEVEKSADPVVTKAAAPEVEKAAPPVVEKAAAPVVEETADPVVEKTADPVVEKPADTAVEKTAAPVVEKTADPVVDKTADPVVEKTADPVVEKTADTVVEKTADPVAEKTADPVAEKTADPVVEKAAAPVVATAIAKVATASAAPVTRATASPVTRATAALVTRATAAAVNRATAAAVNRATAAPVTKAAAAPLVATTAAAAPVVKVAAASVAKASVAALPVTSTPVKGREAPAQKSFRRVKPKDSRMSHICRCGTTSAPGKATCRNSRCTCYVAGKSCVDCKCIGCKNPHQDPTDSSEEESDFDFSTEIVQEDLAPARKEHSAPAAKAETAIAANEPTKATAAATGMHSGLTLVPLDNLQQSQHPLVLMENENGQYQGFNIFNGTEPVDPAQLGFQRVPLRSNDGNMSIPEYAYVMQTPTVPGNMPDTPPPQRSSPKQQRSPPTPSDERPAKKFKSLMDTLDADDDYGLPDFSPIKSVDKLVSGGATSHSAAGDSPDSDKEHAIFEYFLNDDDNL